MEKVKGDNGRKVKEIERQKEKAQSHMENTIILSKKANPGREEQEKSQVL